MKTLSLTIWRCLVSAVLSIVFALHAAGQSTLQPNGWDSQIRLAEAPDTNPDPHIVEVDIEAKIARVAFAPNQEVEAWTYNGSIPGPLIRARVGDRLIVHFKNNLPVPTTMHWHGMRVPI